LRVLSPLFQLSLQCNQRCQAYPIQLKPLKGEPQHKIWNCFIYLFLSEPQHKICNCFIYLFIYFRGLVSLWPMGFSPSEGILGLVTRI
jgi:hypothetical protein